MDWLGRLAQDALYYHEGPTAPIPQDLPRYAHQMSIPAGIRKAGPWVVCLSGIVDTQAVNSQFYLDRQSHLSVFHKKAGLIISGANSKRQPELATFMEKDHGQIFNLPVSSRLQMSERQDRLSLAHNTFFADLYVPVPTENELHLRVVKTGKGTPAEETRFNLQLVFRAGETLETGAGKKFVLGVDRLELQPQDLGGWIRHNNWTLNLDPAATLTWPYYPYNPYMNGPEKTLEHAVGVISVPLRSTREEHDWYVRPGEQEISFRLTVE